MPVYPYKCDEHEFEIYLPFEKYTPEIECVVCQKLAKRKWGTSPVIFRPDGWNLSPDDPKYFKDLKDKEVRPEWQR